MRRLPARRDRALLSQVLPIRRWRRPIRVARYFIAPSRSVLDGVASSHRTVRQSNRHQPRATAGSRRGGAGAALGYSPTRRVFNLPGRRRANSLGTSGGRCCSTWTRFVAPGRFTFDSPRESKRWLRKAVDRAGQEGDRARAPRVPRASSVLTSRPVAPKAPPCSTLHPPRAWHHDHRRPGGTPAPGQDRGCGRDPGAVSRWSGWTLVKRNLERLERRSRISS